MAVAGCGVIEESLAAGFLVSELVCKSVFNCGQIRGRENTKDLWGLQRCCKPEPLTCQQQIWTSLYHLVLLSFLGGEEQESIFGRVGIAGMALTGAFPWAGRMNVVCMGTDVEVRAGKGGKDPVGSMGWLDMVSHPLSFELLGFARNSDAIAR